MMEEEQVDSTENKLTSERYDAFCGALDLLYVPGNLGGRLQFMKAWPAAAAYIFGAELIAFDTQGGVDKERRAELEQEASERRLALSQIAVTLEKKSADKGVLQTEYVESVVKDLGRDLALLLYAPRFVDRIFPPPPEEEGKEKTQRDAPLHHQPERKQPQKPVLSDEIADGIRPISTDQPMPEPSPSPEADIEVPKGPISYDQLRKIGQGEES